MALRSAALALGVLLVANSAGACVAVTPPSVYALRPHDIAIVGRVEKTTHVTQPGGVLTLHTVDIHVTDVPIGEYGSTAYLLSWGTMGGLCGPPGPGGLRVGDIVVVYLDRTARGLAPGAWLRYDEAASIDRRINPGATPRR